MRNFLIVAGLALLAVYASPSHAQDYHWYWISSPTNTGVDPAAMCRAAAANRTVSGGYEKTGIVELYAWNESRTEVGCRFQQRWIATGSLEWISLGGMRRGGTECPADTVYDPETGVCNGAPSCSGTAGESFPFSRTGSAGSGELVWTIASSGSGWQIDDKAACNDGCAATITRSKCVVRVSGDYVCGGTAEYTGEACPASTSGPAPPVTTEILPEPTTDHSAQPCVYETQPDGTMRCRSETTVEIEGQLCGEFNGQRLCTNRQPKSDGTTIDTTVRTDTQADGSRTITKTDTATKTTCVGAGACTTTTTTTTTTTHQDANGNATGETSTCVGAACPNASNPDGDGDGIGDCIDGDCGDGGGPELGDVPGFGEALGDFWERAGNAPIVSALDGIGLQGTGTCSFPSVTVEYLGTLRFDVICEQSGWLDVLYGLMLAVWSLAAVRLFFTA